MGVYIKGMEMPKDCLECYCTDSEYGECVIDPQKRCPDDYKKRADWCPLVPVPPHGRLGDLDALRKRIEENIDAAKKAGNYEWWYACTVALDFALAAPTVIPAEEGE